MAARQVGATGVVALLSWLSACGGSASKVAPAASPIEPAKPTPVPQAAIAAPVVPPAQVDCSLSFQPPRGQWEMYFGGPDRPNSAQEVSPDSANATPWALASCERLRKQGKAGQTLSCYQSTPPSSSGLWSVATFDRRASSDYLHWQLIYTDGKGKTVKGERFIAGNGDDPAIEANDAPTLPSVLSVVDLDGDGVQELMTGVSKWMDAGNHLANAVDIWAVKDGHIVRFAATAALWIIFARDVNDDGRPELMVDPYRVLIGSGYSGWDTGSALWSTLVEIDPQGRVVDSASMSRAYAREMCPSPDGLLEGLKGLDDEACVGGYVHCANWWGLPDDQIVAALEAFCQRASLPGYLGLCTDSLASWVQMTSTALPFQLERQP